LQNALCDADSTSDTHVESNFSADFDSHGDTNGSDSEANSDVDVAIWLHLRRAWSLPLRRHSTEQSTLHISDDLCLSL